jgi:hypothetical protein
MKLTVLVPSETYKSSAGARIRYSRLAPELAKLGIELTLSDLTKEHSAALEADIVLISKCYDARALVVVGEAKVKGKLVGVDLFDDYFSDRTDTRLVGYRSWLSQMIAMTDFCICSTARMAEVARGYDDACPVHLLNDPAPSGDPRTLAAVVAAKVAAARDTGLIEIAWFGVGDNRNFSVGLSDLAAYGGMLAQLKQGGLQPRLTVLTNHRALTDDGLALIRGLPVQAEVHEWSESAEAALLEGSLAVFLPVNGQPFSAAKSLNRAVTALSAGCQVLSAGYPLYAALDPLVYRSASELAEDLAQADLRLSAASIDDLERALIRVASAQTEAERLARFLSGTRPRQKMPAALVLIHGRSTLLDAHRMVKAAGGISVASPYCTADFDFDVLFRGGNGGLQMLVSRDATKALLPHKRSLARPLRAGGHYFALGNAVVSSQKATAAQDWTAASIAFQLATYAKTLAEMERRLTDAFGGCRIMFSERSQLQFASAAGGRDANAG